MEFEDKIKKWCESMKDKPVGGMNSKEILAWFIAYQEAECVADMTQKEIGELLLDGFRGFGEFTMYELIDKLEDAQAGHTMDVITELNNFYK